MNLISIKKLIFFYLILLFLSFNNIYSQIFTGNTSSYIYNWKVQDQQWGSSSQLRWYQSLILNVKDIKNPNFSIYTNTRYTKDFLSDKLYNDNLKIQYFYGEIKNIYRTLDLKFGRQYVYSGVGIGSIDGIMSKVKLKKIADFEIYGGVPVSWYNDLKIQKWNENRMYGFRVVPRMFLKTLFGISYTRKFNKPIPYNIPGKYTFKKWNITSDAMDLFGVDFYTKLSEKIDAYGRIDFDMTFNDIYRGNFYFNTPLKEKFSLSAEYYFRKPRIYSNSIFSVFAQSDNHEYWMRIYYNVKKNLNISGGIAVVEYSDDRGFRYNLNLNTEYVNIGYNRTSGYSGRLDGLTGSVNYPIRKNIWLRSGSNIMRYRLFESLEDFKNLLSTFVGVHMIPKKSFTLDIEAQGLHNYNYTSDFRILFQSNYWFSFRKSEKR